MLIVIISSAPILKFAPVADANKPIGSIQHRNFRKKSLSILIAQSSSVIALSIFSIILSFCELNFFEKSPYICLSFAIGQLSASGSLVAAKICDVKGGVLDDC